MRTVGLSIAAVGISVLLAACGSDEGTSTSTPDEPSPTASQSPSPVAASPLEGNWETAAVSPSDAEATLRESGLSKWIKDFRSNAPFGADTVLILEINEGLWNLYGKSKGGPREEIDYDAFYDIKGNKVIVTHGEGDTTFRWSVDGNALTLKVVGSTFPPSKGVPDEVFQRALYETEEFKKR